MKKYIPILALFLIINGCEIDKFEYEKPEIIDQLIIDSNIGIKLESYFVEDIVKMNVKTNEQGTYIIRITDITDKTVSMNEIKVEKGDNIVNLYTRTIPVSSYRIKLFDKNNNLLSLSDFNKIK